MKIKNKNIASLIKLGYNAYNIFNRLNSQLMESWPQMTLVKTKGITFEYEANTEDLEGQSISCKLIGVSS